MKDINYPKEIHERVEKGVGCASYIGKGWYNIIIELDIKIAKTCPDYVVNQVKEKFGTLRYYIGNISDECYEEVQELILDAESKSAKTCDVCGKQVITQTTINSWIVTRCKEHI